MTAQELYDLSQSYLKGKEGMPKNEAKGWETMRQAAEAGHEQALKEFSLHIAETEPHTAVKFIEKSATAFEDKRYTSLYIRALYQMIGKNTAIATENCDKAAAHFDENTADGNTCYFYGKLLQLAHADEANKYLKRAAIMGSKYLTADDFKLLGRQKGIISPDELKIWVDGYTNPYGAYSNKVYTVECAKNEGMAKVIVDAQLDEQSTAKKLGKSRVRKMKKLAPTVILEYQKIIEASVTIGNYPFSYKHKRSSTIDGTGNIQIDTPYSDFATTYQYSVKNDDLNAYANKYRFTKDELPSNARIRAYTDNDAAIEDDVRVRIRHTQSAVEDQKAVELVLTRYNWLKENTYVYFRSDGEYHPQHSVNAIFVPFWFFIYDLKGETVSVRVDAFTGETAFFVDNPYGQYQPGDDIKTGGCAVEPSPPVKFSVILFLFLACMFPIGGGILYLLIYLVQKGKQNAKRKKNAV